MTHAFQTMLADAIQGNVLVLTSDPILALDLDEALYAAGLASWRKASVRACYSAIIVDVDQLGRRSAAVVRRHARGKRPVVLIADDCDEGVALGLTSAVWVTKPLSADAVAHSVAALLAEAGVPRGPTLTLA